jgi:hypothetical protein
MELYVCIIFAPAETMTAMGGLSDACRVGKGGEMIGFVLGLWLGICIGLLIAGIVGRKVLPWR